MRKKIKLSGIAFVLLGVLGIAFYPAMSVHAACPADMISYWKLNETTGPTYADLFGKNDGVGAPGPAAAPGIIGGAQYFSGIAGQAITVPASRSFSWLGSESFSIELWVKTDGAPAAGISNNQVMISRQESSTGMQWWLGRLNQNAGGKAFFYMTDGSGNEVLLTDPGEALHLPADAWRHLVVVRDGESDETALWVDGVSVASDSQIFPRGFGSDTPLYLGELDDGFRFKGWLDEVALYDRALSETEIQAHYAGGQPSTDYCQGALPEPEPSPIFAPLPDNTISYWPLDNPGPTYVDVFGKNDGVGDPGPAAADGIVGGGQYFEGIVGQAITVPASRSFSWLGSESFSIELWVKTDGAPGTAMANNQVMIARQESLTGMQWWLGRLNQSAGGKAFFFMTDGSVNEVQLTDPGDALHLLADAWRHLVVVRDGETGETALWVDGVSVASDVQEFPRGFGSDTPLYLGELAGGFRFKGWLDEVALYDRALSEMEIQAHFEAGLAGDGSASLRPAPTAGATFSPDAVIEGAQVTLDGTVSEPGYAEAPIVAYLWEQTAGDVVTLTNANTATATFTAPQVGEAGATLSFQLTVTAADQQPGSAVITIPISADSTPDPDPDPDPDPTPDPDPDPVPTPSSGSSGGCFINSIF